ncbi:hypothetical protein TSUD_228340 [Trifolium subterraneum]|uniref:Uncharacterized protein n=1 Tax=Trifolium subterraneum TaxID=3900 RepID=A0A2Z6LMF2_TRISU|nr:hypothetical protein TSUD_228340 [Trifolium subterraneum]
MKSGVVEEEYKAQIEESDGEEREHGCNYVRLWKDPLPQLPRQYMSLFSTHNVGSFA